MTRSFSILLIAFVLGWCLLATASTAALAQAVSEPQVALPQLPDAGGDTIEIPDLDEAPPAAREPILELALLGAYPLDANLYAYPNEFLTPSIAAYMLVNLFSLRLVDEFPVPPAQALPLLEVITETSVPPDAPVTVGTMRDWILIFVDLTSAEDAQLGAALDEQYPALAAGNPDAPITRAGAALMIVIALEHLYSLQP